MPNQAGLTVVADWDDAKVRKGLESLKEMFQKGFGGLSVDSSGALRGLKRTQTKIDELKASVKLAKNEFQSFLAMGGTSASPQGQQLAAAYHSVNEQLQQINRTTKGTQDAYARLSRIANEATRWAQNLGVQYGTTSERFLIASKRANELTQRLKDVDAATGRNYRNVGNYASGYNAIAVNMARIVGEMPNFTQSMRLGFMAISNNIQPLAESIQELMRRNKELAAQGQPTTSALKAIGGALFSWNTLLLIGVTALSAYGPKLVEFIRGNEDAAEAARKLEERQKEVNRAVDESNREAGKQIANIKILTATILSEATSRKEQQAALKSLKELYPNHLKNLSLDAARSGELAKIINNELVPAILAAARARAYERLVEENEAKILKLRKDDLKNAKEVVKTVNQLRIARERAAEAAKSNSFSQGTANLLGFQEEDTENAIKRFRSTRDEIRATERENQVLISGIVKLNEQIKSLDVPKNLKKYTSGAGRETEKLSQTIRDIESALLGIETQKELGLIGQFEYLTEKSKVLNNGINKLTKDFNVPATNSTLLQWSNDALLLEREIRRTEMAFDGLSNKAAKVDVMGNLEKWREKPDRRWSDLNKAITPDFDKIFKNTKLPKDVEAFYEDLQNRIKKSNDDTKREVDRLKGIISEGISSGLMGLGESIGNVFAGIENPFNSLLSYLGGAIKEFGKYLIEIGGIREAISKGINALGITGVPAIIAGIGAVALGTYLQSIANKRGRQSFRPMASGGVVYGPTYALVGEYAGAYNNPEVVAPLDKLKGLIRDSGGGHFTASYTLKGNDLVTVIERTKAYNDR